MVNKNQNTGVKRMPIFSNRSQNRFTSKAGSSVIMAYPKLQTASVKSMAARKFNPAADGLRDKRTAMTEAATVFNNNIDAKMIQYASKKT